MTDTHVFDILARAVAQEGSDTCFALMGDANMNFATRLGENGCRMIYVRHEHCAAAAAMAWARKTGEVGLATVTCGPGLTQLMTALPAAVRAHLPLVVIAGEAPLKSGWYNQGIDQAPFVTATGAAYHSLHHVERMPVAIRDAFLQARREKRPVVVGIPFDLQNKTWTGSVDLPVPSHELLPRPAPMPPAPQDLDAAVKLVDQAERVVILAGLGASDPKAVAACRALAERTGGLLATTLPARGLFHDDPFSIGIAGGMASGIGKELLGQSDLVIAVGCSLAYHAGGGGQLWPKAEMLQIDLDPVAVAQGQEVARHHMRADAEQGILALRDAVDGRARHWRSDEVAERIRTTPADSAPFDIDPGLLDPRDVVSALESAVPADWEHVSSSGHCSWFFNQMPSRPYDRFLTIREFGAIGNGTSFAMGVACARPDNKVVLFDGDGSFLMHVQELETMKRHGMDILIVVMNDGAYGSEIHKLRAEGISDAGAVFGYPDLAAVAKGFGLTGHKVTDLSSLPELVGAYASRGGVEVWDFQVSDKVTSPVVRR
ncbi:MAG: thiamine pyrophosphate-binding protein [Thalassovita sp.]|nr:thiamine pyrophosphate-binding protein [Thalassovita sp.]